MLTAVLCCLLEVSVGHEGHLCDCGIVLLAAHHHLELSAGLGIGLVHVTVMVGDTGVASANGCHKLGSVPLLRLQITAQMP